jgi:RNA polymerase sigma-70 factor (ECF subfamily)
MTESMAKDENATEAPTVVEAIFASESAFRAFYEAALPRVYGYLYSRCGADPTVAEELTQQTFVTAVREHSRFKGKADALTWLTAIARHKLADHFRRLDREERRRLRLVVREIELQPGTRAWDRLGEREVLIGALRTLPALQRAVLVLHYADGLSVREVAAQLGRSESSVESLMTRGREGFRRAYGKVLDV